MNDEVTMNVITLDNQKEYFVLDKILHNQDTFVYLALKENPEEIVIRKRIVESEEVFLEEIANLDELQLAFSLFFKKHPELLKESL